MMRSSPLIIQELFEGDSLQLLKNSSPAYGQVDSSVSRPNLAGGLIYGQKKPVNDLKWPLPSQFEHDISQKCLIC